MTVTELQQEVDAHPAQKLLRELLGDPLFHEALMFDVAHTTAWMEEGLLPKQREAWNALDEKARDIIRKQYFNYVTDQGQTLVCAFLRTDLLRRRAQGLIPLYDAIVDSRRLARVALAAAMK